MKITKELRKLSDTDLKEKLREFKMELLKLNAQIASGASAENPGMIRLTKKNIARILTLFKEREGKNQ